MNVEKLRKIAMLTEALKDRGLARLSRALAEREEIADRIAAVNKELKTRSAEIEDMSSADAALMSGADIRWLDHQDRQRQRLQAQLANAAAKAEEIRLSAARDFGRDLALRKLIERRK